MKIEMFSLVEPCLCLAAKIVRFFLLAQPLEVFVFTSVKIVLLSLSLPPSDESNLIFFRPCFFISDMVFSFLLIMSLRIQF